MIKELIGPVRTLFKYFPERFWTVAVLMAFLLVLVSVVLYKRKKGKYIFFVTYLNVLYFVTVFGRYAKTYYRFLLVPYFSFSVEKIANIIVFIPIGFACGRYGYGKKSVAVGLLVSLGIEFFQLLLKKGTFETMDLITNTLGAFLGYGVYKLCNKVVPRRISKSNDHG